MKVGNAYGENLDFFGGIRRGAGKTDSMVVLEKNEMCRQRSASRVASGGSGLFLRDGSNALTSRR